MLKNYLGSLQLAVTRTQNRRRVAQAQHQSDVQSAFGRHDLRTRRERSFERLDQHLAALAIRRPHLNYDV
jgi:hypothetical protein